MAIKIEQASDGGYIITGLTYSYVVGLSHIWLLKIRINIPQQHLRHKHEKETVSFVNIPLLII